ncbi:hypothetical protein B0H65DRAFT_476291 [Neurospora tetraspora]|uniref:Uncharacterized protein n=1 Tax=Neurospora tetraspora TaxID=94610 RepID=A0AAE0MP46_9PEZI|nr:hypothetical protein B0H65DRAFT_476291 [Neurospora tetraspora]
MLKMDGCSSFSSFLLSFFHSFIHSYKIVLHTGGGCQHMQYDTIRYDTLEPRIPPTRCSIFVSLSVHRDLFEN